MDLPHSIERYGTCCFFIDVFEQLLGDVPDALGPPIIAARQRSNGVNHDRRRSRRVVVAVPLENGRFERIRFIHV